MSGDGGIREIEVEVLAAEPREDAHFDLAARVLVAALISSRYERLMNVPFLPYFRGFDALEHSQFVCSLFRWGLRGSLVLAALPGGARLAALLAGGSVLGHVFVNRAGYSTACQAYGHLLLQMALRGSRLGSIPARFHLAMVYAGAGFNKLLLEDWRSGKAFRYFSDQLVENPGYRWLARHVPAGAVGKAGAWGSIAFEFTIGLLYLFRRTAGLAALLGLVFHLSCMLYTRGTIAWIYMKFALGTGALLLGGRPPAAKGSLVGSVARYGFWFGALGVVHLVEQAFRPAYKQMRNRTPTLDALHISSEPLPSGVGPCL